MSRTVMEPNPFKKVTGDVAFDAGQIDASLSAIIKVKEDGYVPEGVKVRSRIDDTMFTAEFGAHLLKKLDRDSNVKSVAVSRRLQIID